jgi:hypothetical protein
MAKYTLLELVQTILSSMDSDEVNSISDTVESNQVALLVKSVFFDLASDFDLPEHKTLFELTASGSSLRPTLMMIPDNVKNIDWVKYNNKLDAETHSNYKDVTYLELTRFLEMVNRFRSETNIGTMDITNNSETFEILFRTDKHPTYYTSLDDDILIFDSYFSDDDTTLQKSKTMCSGSIYPVFTLSDGFTPDLNMTQFALLLNACKERAFVELKQMENVNAARESRRQRIINQYQKQRAEKIPAIYTAPRYGRR